MTRSTILSAADVHNAVGETALRLATESLRTAWQPTNRSTSWLTEGQRWPKAGRDTRHKTIITESCDVKAITCWFYQTPKITILKRHQYVLHALLSSHRVLT